MLAISTRALLRGETTNFDHIATHYGDPSVLNLEPCRVPKASSSWTGMQPHDRARLS